MLILLSRVIMCHSSFMKEYFLAGLICLFNPYSEQPICMKFHEEPIIYYSFDECRAKSIQKVNEIGTNFTNQGFEIAELKIYCLVDKNQKNT